MPRYILIDNHSGYIFGDSADYNGHIAHTPLDYAAALDASIGEHGRTYTEVSSLAANETGYRVYRADLNGSDAVTVVHDGQNQETIEAVERDCDHVCTIKIWDAPSLLDRLIIVGEVNAKGEVALTEWLRDNLAEPIHAEAFAAHMIAELDGSFADEQGMQVELGRFKSRDGNPAIYRFGADEYNLVNYNEDA